MKFFLLPFTVLFLFPIICFSQKGETTVGIQIKPVFPIEFIGTNKIVNDVESVHFETALKSGLSSGLIVRHNFSDLVAFETGISYVGRKYTLTITENNYMINSDFKVVSYEIPAMLMVYAQIGEKTYINGSMGPCLDMFASSIQTVDTNYKQVAFRNHVFLPAISANVGFEYRTEKSGSLYFGFSFQRPFSFIYLSKVAYYKDNKEFSVANEISGAYLTIDLRYYFPVVDTKNVDEY